MINQSFYSSIPTKLDLNGPYMSFTSIPSGISGNPGSTVSLTGIATASFLGVGATTVNDGVVLYRWYEVGVGALSDGNRLSGTSTNTLTISNLQSPGDSNRRFYLEAKYQSTAYKNRLDGKNGNHITPAVSDPAAASVIAPQRPRPTASITASSTSIGYNGSVTISWSTTNANTLTSNFGDTRLNGSRTFRNQTSSRTFSITATNETGSRSASTFVSVASPITPSINLSLSPSSIPYNGSTTVTWSSTNATSVVSSNFGATGVNGSITLTNQTQSRTLSITVRSADGVQRTASAFLSVASPITPSINLSLSPSSILYNGSTTLTWSSTNATSVVSSNFGATDVNGSITLTNQTQSRTFSITVRSADGVQRTESVSLSVASQIIPTITLTASPSSIISGESTTLTWSSTNATSVVSSNFGATDVNGSTVRTNQTQSTNYNITVASADGTQRTANASLTVDSIPLPTATISASPSSVDYNGSTTVTWSTSNATSLSSNFGETTLSGSKTFTNLTQDDVYTITATNTSGSVSASANVSVAAPIRPTATISASPSSVNYNGSATVTWSTTNATSLSSNFGTTALSGSQTFTNLTSNQSYTITATNVSESVSATANVSVGAPPKTLLTLNASPESIGNGGSTTLTWSTTNATSLSSNFGVTALSGSTTLSGLVETKEYEATATGPGGSITKRVLVTVAAPVPIIVITSQPSPVSATFNKCSGGGGSVNFSVGASVNNPTGATLSYQWYLNGSALSNSATVGGAQSSTLTLRVLENQSGNNNVYVRVSYSGASTVQSNNVPYSVTVIEPRPTLSITSQPTNQTVFVDETATFSVQGSISDGRAVAYQWYFSNGQRISGATESIYRVTPTSAGTQSFYAEVSDPQSTCTAVPALIESNIVTLTANEQQKIIRVARRGDLDTSISYSDINLSTFDFGSTGNWEFYSPFEDLQVDVLMRAGAGPSKSGNSGGQGGVSIVRLTLRRNTEYIIRSFTSTENGGGGSTVLYEKARLLAVVGGGGGAGTNGSGGNGGGVGLSGQSGSGSSGGTGGGTSPGNPGYFPGGSVYDESNTRNTFTTSGRISICTLGDFDGNWYEIDPCSDYGGRPGDERPIRPTVAYNAKGQLVNGSATLSRGFKGGVAHRNNGGFAQTSNEGAGGYGAFGGAAGATSTRSGGGGGGGYAGGVSIVDRRTGGNTGSAQFTIALPGRLRL